VKAAPLWRPKDRPTGASAANSRRSSISCAGWICRRPGTASRSMEH
jgi:hypothetical protein